MQGPRVSVVIVSRGRPALLQRCLTALSQQLYNAFELIVVADPDGIAAVSALPFAGSFKQVPFDVPNVSAARNAGIAEAGGEIVAFIDDDAAPEPTWLQYLSEPFADPDVGVAGGYVIGRNGISYQWLAQSVDRMAITRDLEHVGDDVLIHPPNLDRVAKTQGTNMAVRRSLLKAIGGFDGAFAYFLDDSDLNIRAAEAGAATAIVPLAQVHHGYAAGAHRRADRVPRSLTELGASTAYFLRTHAGQGGVALGHRTARLAQRQRLIAHLVRGGLEPRDFRRLQGEFDVGWEAGLARKPARIVFDSKPREFLTFPARNSAASRLLWGRPSDRKRLTEEARARVAGGDIVTVMIFSRTALYHRAGFAADGFWFQSGGIWGRSVRSGPLFWQGGLRSRVLTEARRIAPLRALVLDDGLETN